MVLNEATLVINKHWVAVDFTTVRDAICMIYTEVAKVVLPDYSVYDFKSWADLRVAEGESFIQTVSLQIKVPEVIVLTNFDKLPMRRVVLSRRNLLQRDHSTCQYCGERLDSEEATIDHVLPRFQGGQTTWTNCVIACVDCNRQKANRTPLQAHMTLLRHPRRPKWNPALKFPIFKKRVSWENFIAEAYWTTELID